LKEGDKYIASAIGKREFDAGVLQADHSEELSGSGLRGENAEEQYGLSIGCQYAG
jgi:hypothetical protein